MLNKLINWKRNCINCIL